MARRTSTQKTIDAYIATRQAKGVSHDHIEALHYRLGKLAAAHPTLPDRPEPLELTLASFKHLADATREDIWAAWRVLYKWAATRHGVTNAMLLVEKPTNTRTRVLPTLTRVQAEQLLFTNRRNHRNYALLTFALDTGARLGELTGLTWANIIREGDDFHAKISGKRGERNVPISHHCIAALQRAHRSDALWTHHRTGEALTKHGIQVTIKRCLRRAGHPGGPHLLRHTFGRLYILAGGDVFSLKEIMGHKSIETTMKYVYLNQTEIQHQHAQFSPIARIAAERPQ